MQWYTFAPVLSHFFSHQFICFSEYLWSTTGGLLQRSSSVSSDATLTFVISYLIYALLGKRPFGVSLLYMGWDEHFGYQLYQSDPSGNYTGWKATCIGNNHQVTTFFTFVGSFAL